MTNSTIPGLAKTHDGAAGKEQKAVLHAAPGTNSTFPSVNVKSGAAQNNALPISEMPPAASQVRSGGAKP